MSGRRVAELLVLIGFCTSLGPPSAGRRSQLTDADRALVLH